MRVLSKIFKAHPPVKQIGKCLYMSMLTLVDTIFKNTFSQAHCKVAATS